MLSPSSGSEFSSPAITKREWGREPAATTAVIEGEAHRSGGDVVGPEADLVEVAGAVPILRPVEDRRRGVADEEVDRVAVHQNRYVPVALRREPEHGELRGRVPVGRSGTCHAGGRGGLRELLVDRHILGATLV
jgi:hypothetical protein